VGFLSPEKFARKYGTDDDDDDEYPVVTDE
jgi:hypothetical protein